MSRKSAQVSKLHFLVLVTMKESSCTPMSLESFIFHPAVSHCSNLSMWLCVRLSVCFSVGFFTGGGDDEGVFRTDERNAGRDARCTCVRACVRAYHVGMLRAVV